MKPVPKIIIDQVRRLPYVDESVRKAFDHAIGWLSELPRYACVPRRTANGAPSARLTDEWVAALLKHGVVEPTTRAAVQGWVRMFAVAEVAKRRHRPIKFTKDVNDALGRDTLMKLRFPSKADLVQLVHSGSHFVALDFAAYFDQFEYVAALRPLFCFRHGGKFFQLRNLAMGQRQAVETAHCTTELLLNFPGARSHHASIIDNVWFSGSADDALHDAAEFVRRVRAVGGLLNEDVSDLPGLLRTSGEWCGVMLDLTNKTVALTEKSLQKVRASWERRAQWTWRGFAAHVGLLFWAWGILELPMPEFFPALSFVSRVGRDLTADASLWDAPAFIWASVWPVLDRWTALLLANKPRKVPKESTPEWLVMSDASRWGWGYVALQSATGELRHHGAPWSAEMERCHGDRLGAASSPSRTALSTRCVICSCLERAPACASAPTTRRPASPSSGASTPVLLQSTRASLACVRLSPR